MIKNFPTSFITLFFSFWITLLPAESEKIPVDLSFISVDLKYNKKEGVKICEINPGSGCGFNGYLYVFGEHKQLAKQFCDILSQFQKTVWLVEKGMALRLFRKTFKDNGWIAINDIRALAGDPLFLNQSQLPVYDPNNLHDYHGMLYVSPKTLSQKEMNRFKETYPGIVIMDTAVFPYRREKLKANLLFDQHKDLSKFRPKWKACKKKYTKNLAKSIIDKIDAEVYVIKPIRGYQGKGIIIVEKKDLDLTLKCILQKKHTLKSNPDSSYRYWARDSADSFIVEEFIKSDPIAVPSLHHRRYDPTMRVPIFLLYNQNKIKVICAEGTWRTPKKSLDENGTLTEKHKSFGREKPYNAVVAPEVMKEVEKQLQEAMTLLYEQMLGISYSVDKSPPFLTKGN